MRIAEKRTMLVEEWGLLLAVCTAVNLDENYRVTLEIERGNDDDSTNVPNKLSWPRQLPCSPIA
jgi:hypothetical protein